MAQKRKRRAPNRRKPRIQSEKYSIRALHEDREYGMYWYAWLWKLLRPVLIFLCSVLVVIGIVYVGYNRIYAAFFAPVAEDSASTVAFSIDTSKSSTLADFCLLETTTAPPLSCSQITRM